MYAFYLSRNKDRLFRLSRIKKKCKTKTLSVFPTIPNPVHQRTQQSIQKDCCTRLHVSYYRFITINVR
ncbi:MAG: hypothetical protein HFI02_16575 [Lachnospiraceae bacterium]|nr:hypothetical protein [Lachnospiraceae bacterium]